MKKADKEKEEKEKPIEEHKVTEADLRSTPFLNLKKCIFIGDHDIGKSSAIFSLSHRISKKISIPKTNDTYFYKVDEKF